MEIRFAKDTDIESLKNIWSVCFGDSDEYINFFFCNMFKKENAIVAVIDEKIAGVVHLLDANLNGKPFKYGYAIGVLPEYRGNSICKKMHDFIKELSVKKGFIYGLHPANDKLSLFYQSIGLNKMYSLKFKEEENFARGEKFEISDISPEEYLKIRDTHFKNIVSWNIETIKYMFDEAKHFGGFAKKIKIDGSYKIMLVKVYNNTIYVKETTMNDDEIGRTSGFINNFFGGEKIYFSLPNNSALNTVSKTTIYGFGEENNDVYMNLFFD